MTFRWLLEDLGNPSTSVSLKKGAISVQKGALRHKQPHRWIIWWFHFHWGGCVCAGKCVYVTFRQLKAKEVKSQQKPLLYCSTLTERPKMISVPCFKSCRKGTGAGALVSGADSAHDSRYHPLQFSIRAGFFFFFRAKPVPGASGVRGEEGRQSCPACAGCAVPSAWCRGGHRPQRNRRTCFFPGTATLAAAALPPPKGNASRRPGTEPAGTSRWQSPPRVRWGPGPGSVCFRLSASRELSAVSRGAQKGPSPPFQRAGGPGTGSLPTPSMHLFLKRRSRRCHSGGERVNFALHESIALITWCAASETSNPCQTALHTPLFCPQVQ